MIFEQKKSIEDIGKKLGFFFSYVLFTYILFFVFSFFNKLPANWILLDVAGVTLLIVLTGIIIRRLLQ